VVSKKCLVHGDKFSCFGNNHCEICFFDDNMVNMIIVIKILLGNTS